MKKLESLKSELFEELIQFKDFSLASVMGGAEEGAGTRTGGGITETGIRYCWDCTDSAGLTTLCTDADTNEPACDCDATIIENEHLVGFHMNQGTMSSSLLV